MQDREPTARESDLMALLSMPVRELADRVMALEDALREVYNRANDYRRYIQAHSVVPTQYYAETERRLLAMTVAMDNAMDSIPPPRRFQVEDARLQARIRKLERELGLRE
jgi:hypothetical protein